MRFVVIGLAAAVLAGCAKKEAAPKPAVGSDVAVAEAPVADAAAGTGAVAEAPLPTDAELDATLKDAVGMLAAMAGAVDRSGTDCPALASALGKVLDEHQALSERLKTYRHDAELAKRFAARMAGSRDQVMTSLQKVAGAGERCRSDASFGVIMARFHELGG